MPPMSSKLRIKLGSLEVDYEGTDEFIKEQLPGLLKTLHEMRVVAEAESEPEPAPGGNKTIDTQFTGDAASLSTNTIAGKLAAKTGSDLLKAAAIRLGIVQKKVTFTRKELLAEMRAAPHFYKKSYANNIDKSFKVLTEAGVILLQSDNTFALAANKRADLAKAIA
jgi:hypothetical protein